MNWLTRIDLNAETTRQEGIKDSYDWHKKLWVCFPDTPEAKRDFLTRVDIIEGAFRVWILAERKPLRPPWCSVGDFQVKKIASSFLSHRYYAFDLIANPTKCIVQRDKNGSRKRQGKRIPLVKESDLRTWLERKGYVRCRDPITGEDVPGGFRLAVGKPLEIRPMLEHHFRKMPRDANKKQVAYHGGVQFRGVLEVTDRNYFIETYKTGIGSAKSFGFGLLLLAPIILQPSKGGQR